MTTISAQTILSSQHADLSHRLTTMLLRYPRWIHAEQRTHRVIPLCEDFEISLPTPGVMECADLSRNAGSSRALPVSKLIADVEADPAFPLFWGRNQSGMQASKELEGKDLELAKAIWQTGLENALQMARALADVGAHKQLANRYLEPFSHITVLVTATEWDNFLELRDHEDAEPHIQMLARAIRAELDKPAMQTLRWGEWHLPFITDEDRRDSGAWASAEGKRLLIKKSVACCASTSYKTVDGFDMTFERSQAIYEKLVGSTPLHASPLEHQAVAADWAIQFGDCVVQNPELQRNFRGFEQYRAIMETGAFA